MITVSLLLRPINDQPSLIELIGEGVLQTMPTALFSLLLGAFGGWAKPLLVGGIALGIAESEVLTYSSDISEFLNDTFGIENGATGLQRALPFFVIVIVLVVIVLLVLLMGRCTRCNPALENCSTSSSSRSSGGSFGGYSSGGGHK